MKRDLSLSTNKEKWHVVCKICFLYAFLGLVELLLIVRNTTVMAALPPFSTSYRQQPSIGTPSSVFRQNQNQPRPASALDLPGLQSASRVLHDQFMKDAQIIPDIGDMLTTRKFENPPVYSHYL